MRSAIRKHLKDFVAILVLVVLAAVVGGYILTQERFRFPFISETPFKLQAEFQTAQAVTPGQGQTVRISGVQIGEISGVKLKEGRAVVQMDIEQKYKKLIHQDATALLRPKTGLKDMFIELYPGRAPAPVVKENWTIPVANTQPDINPDEIYSALDADTRDYLQLLVNGAGPGLDHRGGDLADVLRRFEPTHRDLARLSQAVATRKSNLRRLVHSLHLLNAALAGKQDQLAQLVDSSSAVFHAFASEDQNVSRTVADLPSTLRQTTITLGKVQRFANLLGPTAQHLIPAAQALKPANDAVAPFARTAAPILRTQIRPFVIAARPLVRSLRPAARNLAAATPNLSRSFVVLNHLFNTLGYNPHGNSTFTGEGAEGYLFWLAWLDHQAITLFSVQDANGDYRQLFLALSCTTIKELASGNLAQPLAVPALNLAPLLANPAICGKSTP